MFGPRDLRRQFEAMLEYFYFEFAARYHAPSQFLAGVASRAYPWDMQPGKSFAAIVAHRQWGEPCQPGTPFVVNWLLTDYVAPGPLQRIAMKKRPLEIFAESAEKHIARTDHLAARFTVASQNGGWYSDQQVPLLITVAGAGRGHALHVEPSMKFAARLASRQRRAEVFGVYSFDPAEVVYQKQFRDSKAPLGFAEGLAFRWHLGSRELVREVRANGVRWDGQPRAWKKAATFLLRLGEVRLTLQVAVSDTRLPRATPSLRLAWQNDELRLDVHLLDECDHLTANSRLPGMRFHVRLSDARSRAPSPLQRWFAHEAEPAAVSASAPCHVLHQSPLAQILADEMLGFFLGRAKPPWERALGKR